MSLPPLTREALKQLYEGDEVVQQRRVKETIRYIYASVVACATQMSTTFYIYKLSKDMSPPQSNDEIVAELKLAFPDSSIELLYQQDSVTLKVDWS